MCTEVKVGMKVDIFPISGDILNLSVSAVAKLKSITPGDTWILPGDGYKKGVQKVSIGQKIFLVSVSSLCKST